MVINLRPYPVIVLVSCVLCCAEPSEPTDIATSGTIPTAETSVPGVTTVVATTGRLPLRRRANGKLRARTQVRIKCLSGGVLTVAPTEGRYYKKGALLATTDVRAAKLGVRSSRVRVEEAEWKYRDLLLRLSTGLPPGDTAVTELARNNLLIQSGLPAARIALAEAEYQLTLTRTVAPFAGRAADVEVQAGTTVAPGEELCTLTDPGSLEVEFSLLEQELADLEDRRRVFVTPVARPDLRIPAQLDIVNPLVDDGGLLRVRARLRDAGVKGLYPGMNVTVTLESSAPSAVLVPKAAIVVRSERTLVFTHDAETGRAKWKYVTVMAENDERAAIGEGIEAGEAVIVTGNLTLDHDSPVRVVETRAPE